MKTRVRKEYEEIENKMAESMRAIPWENKQVYASWLAQTYEYAKSATRILALTAGNFPMDQTPHSNRFIQHAAEEKGHDRLLVNDAKALGYDLHAIPLLPEAEAFHKSLYYWIYNSRPGVIMGWIFFLEGLAVTCGAEIASRAEKAHGRAASSFLRVHAQDDIDHIEKAFKLLDQFTDRDVNDTLIGLRLYSSLYGSICTALAAPAFSGAQATPNMQAAA